MSSFRDFFEIFLAHFRTRAAGQRTVAEATLQLAAAPSAPRRRGPRRGRLTTGAARDGTRAGAVGHQHLGAELSRRPQRRLRRAQLGDRSSLLLQARQVFRRG